MVMDVISVIIVVTVLYAIICIPVGLFNIKIFRAIHGAKCAGLNFVKAFIPFYNITFSRNLAYGKATAYNILLIVCALLLLFRVVALALVATFPVLIVFSAVTNIVCIVLYAVLYIINAVDFGFMLGCGITTMLCSVIVAPVGYYMLSSQVLGYFRSVEDEVSGRFGD